MRLYLDNRRGSRDNFYLSTVRQVQETSHLLSMQKLLLD